MAILPPTPLLFVKHFPKRYVSCSMRDMALPYHEDSDASLALRAADEAEAFGELMRRYWPKLHGYVRRSGGLGSDATDDIVQESFIKAYRNIRDFDATHAFTSWIYQITRNTLIDDVRTRQRRHEVGLDDTDAGNLLSASAGIERSLMTHDTIDRVRAIIADLPAVYREVLILRFLEERSYDEIVDIVRKPKGTVSSLVNRGRTFLVRRAREQGLIDTL